MAEHWTEAEITVLDEFGRDLDCVPEVSQEPTTAAYLSGDLFPVAFCLAKEAGKVQLYDMLVGRLVATRANLKGLITLLRREFRIPENYRKSQ